MPLPTLIFDLDGLLADTETLHARAYITALADHGVTLSEAEYAEHWIRHGRGIDALVAQRGIAYPGHVIRKVKIAVYDELLRTALRPMPGAAEILHHFRGRTPLALATSSARRDALRALEALDFARHFDAIVTGDDVAREKPAPDVFLLAAQKLGAAPATCVVIEDAEKGIVAAQAAGMRSIAVPNRLTLHHDFSAATLRCATLAEAAQQIEHMH